MKVVAAIVILLALGQGEPATIKVHDLKGILSSESDTVYVINFWATTCRPCIREMPYFQQAEAAFKDEPVRFYMLSLDDKQRYLDRVASFKEKYGISMQTYLLDAPHYSEWIGDIDSDYWGTMPATLIFNNAKGLRRFFAQEMDREQLGQAIRQML